MKKMNKKNPKVLHYEGGVVRREDRQGGHEEGEAGGTHERAQEGGQELIFTRRGEESDM